MEARFVAWNVMCVTMIIPVAIATMLLYTRKYLGTLKAGWGILLWPACLIGAIALGANRADYLNGLLWGHYYSGHRQEIEAGISVACAGLLVMFCVPFIVHLFNKWTGRSLTDQDRLPGTAGERAWMDPRSVILAILIPLCAWLGVDYSFWGVLALTFGLLLAYPAINVFSQSPVSQPPPPVPQPPSTDLSDERQRVLKLLEDGKTTAEECSELLSALGETVKPPAAAGAANAPAVPGRRLAVIGAALVLVGFFLPWFSVNLWEENHRMTNNASDMMTPQPGIRGPEAMPNMPNAPVPQPPKHGFSISGPVIDASGGDMKNGLGWIVLFLALSAAAVPYFSIAARPRTVQLLRLAGLAVGGIILIYLLTGGIRHASIGLVLAMLGYVLGFVGAGMEARQAKGSVAIS